MSTKSFQARLQRWTSFRLISSFSVRTRIVVIALVPVIGFLMNGFAFTAGETEVERAFDSVRQSRSLEDASREFKDALNRMSISAADFARQPLPNAIKGFNDSHESALQSLERIKLHIEAADADLVPRASEMVASLKTTFLHMQSVQQILGFDHTQGIQGTLSDAVETAEKNSSDLSWLTRVDAQALSILLANMRRYQAEFAQSRAYRAMTLFFEEAKNFNTTLDNVAATDIMKTPLREAVKRYADAFGDWVRESQDLTTALVTLRQNSLELMPVATRIIESAAQREKAASSQLMNSQSRTKQIIIGVGCAAVLIGLVFSWLIGRSITMPMQGLVDAMKRLAAGDTTARIPATGLKDEIGDMARTVIVFRDSMIEREELAQKQAETGRAREQRAENIAATISRFEKSVDSVLAKVRDSARRLEITSDQLNGAADDVSAQAQTAKARVAAASENVTTSAGSVEELAASIAEIASQANQSTEVARRAVSEAQRTTETMSELGKAATRIGEVISLIQAIAGQTNLLALNATIEAARAGEAGRGFAVVASEVKSLAGQTARATEDIASQIGGIQTAAAEAVEAISQVNAIINDMSMIAASVAMTVEEQNSAVATIAEGVTRASEEAQTGAQAMSRVADATADARANAGNVKLLADTLALEAEGLETEVRRFLSEVA